MYGYIFFAIFIVAIFSIFENIKGYQKMSFFKVHLQIALFFIALGSVLFFLDEIGINVSIYTDIARIFGLIALVNIFFILANNKIPRLVIYFEILFVVVLITMVYNGFKYIAIKNGVMNVKLNFIQLFNIFIINPTIKSRPIPEPPNKMFFILSLTSCFYYLIYSEIFGCVFTYLH